MTGRECLGALVGLVALVLGSCTASHIDTVPPPTTVAATATTATTATTVEDVEIGAMFSEMLEPHLLRVWIRNYEDSPVDVSGWQFRSTRGRTFTFPAGTVAPANKSVHLELAGVHRHPCEEHTATRFYWCNTYAPGGHWTNDMGFAFGDHTASVILIDADGRTRDEWSPPT